MNNIHLDAEGLSQAVARLPIDELSQARQSALANIGKTGLPGTRQENWKYTNLAAVAELSNAWLASAAGAQASQCPASELEAQIVSRVDAIWIVLADGKLESVPSQAELEAAGLVVSMLSKDPDRPDLAASDELDNLNVALLRDGLSISAHKGRTSKPLGILYSGAGTSSSVIQERVHLNIESGATLELLECHLSNRKTASFTNSVLHVNLDAGAQVNHVRLQDSGDTQTLIGKTSAVLAESSTYRCANFDFGGQLVRNDFIADINGAGASVCVHGLYLASGQQHIDNHIRVDHRVGPAVSVEDFRGILTGHSRCVFNGKAVVHEGADGTDARQSNHNLLLSDNAEIDTKPELEIYADDVKCSHGATVGQLDESALFYLRSRGIEKSAAEMMLTRAFAIGVTEDLPVAGCRDILLEFLERKLLEMTTNQ